jgi:hypothetical protein
MTISLFAAQPGYSCSTFNFTIDSIACTECNCVAIIGAINCGKLTLTSLIHQASAAAALHSLLEAARPILTTSLKLTCPGG